MSTAVAVSGERKASADELAAAIALAELPRMTPARLRRLLVESRAPDSWRELRAWPSASNRRPAPDWFPSGAGGRHGQAELVELWARTARRVEPAERLAAYRRSGTGAALWWQPLYPAVLEGDPSVSGLLFFRGALPFGRSVASVAVVGTRSATPYGRDVAYELGRALSEAGVVVVSGLSEGITACAQAGAVAGEGMAPVVVAVGGVDVVGSTALSPLWDRVAARGAVVSEVPLSRRADRWRFPWRNRLVAALADVVVVVESHREGAALATAEAAARRGRPVLAVPGSVRSSASRGSNALISDGCTPCLGPEDVLVALSLAGRPQGAARRTGPPAAPGRHDDAGFPLALAPGGPVAPGGSPVTDGCCEEERAVLDGLDDAPVTLATVTARSGLAVGAAALALDRLVGRGLVSDGGGWWCRVPFASPPVYGAAECTVDDLG